MESLNSFAPTSPDGSKFPTLVKQEPDDGISQVVIGSNNSSVNACQPDLSDLNPRELKNDQNNIPIMNIPPIVESDGCNYEVEDDNLTVKLEPQNQCDPSEALHQLTGECGVVLGADLCTVKNEFPYPACSEVGQNHNGRPDLDSQLLEVHGELDGQTDGVCDFDKIVVMGDVHMQNDAVDQKPETSKDISETTVMIGNNSLGE